MAISERSHSSFPTNTNYERVGEGEQGEWGEQEFKKSDVFVFFLKMRTTHIHKQEEGDRGEGSLKNTKINYTKELLV